MNFNIGHFIAEKVPLGLLELAASTPHGVETAAPQECFANGGMMPPRLLAAGDPGECVSRGTAAGCGVGGGAARVGGSVGYQDGDGGLGGEEVGEGELKNEFASGEGPGAIRWSRS